MLIAQPIRTIEPREQSLLFTNKEPQECVLCKQATTSRFFHHSYTENETNEKIENFFHKDCLAVALHTRDLGSPLLDKSIEYIDLKNINRYLSYKERIFYSLNYGVPGFSKEVAWWTLFAIPTITGLAGLFLSENKYVFSFITGTLFFPCMNAAISLYSRKELKDIVRLPFEIFFGGDLNPTFIQTMAIPLAERTAYPFRLVGDKIESTTMRVLQPIAKWIAKKIDPSLELKKDV